MAGQDWQATLDDRLADPALTGLVTERIEVLRKRLLDFTRRNPLMHVVFRPTSATLIRAVDELPDMLRLELTDGEMSLVPLPPLDDGPRDERTDRFQDALFLARREDVAYRAAMEDVDQNDPKALDAERRIERELKDRVRAMLGLPNWSHADVMSLVDHARAQGINPAFDLPHPTEIHDDGRHVDDRIQTLLTPERLRRAGKTILTRGQGIEREIGVNVQHAVFGLLEWRHPEEKETWLSPLLLMEVRFSRHAAVTGEEYRVAGQGAPASNTTLREKFMTEYRLDIPQYEGGSVEDHFDMIRAKAPPGWTWRVRRQVVFGIFPSSRMAMYHDLDPRRRQLGSKSLIARLLASAGGGGPGDYAPDYEPDIPEHANLAPLVVRDADASQWSALVDVLRGLNVAIEGPPGSGKSQTIVNIIAACLADGKRVLFVAEKLTALDVVKSRIEAVGLGEFVLPLQSGKSSDMVYASIADRLQMVTEGAKQAVAAHELRKSQLQTRKTELQGYLDVLAQPFGHSGFSVHDILGRAVKGASLRETLPQSLRRLKVPGIDRLSRAGIEDLVSAAGDLSRALDLNRDVPALWMEATTEVATREQAEDIAATAADLVFRIESLQDVYRQSGLAILEPEGWSWDGYAALLPTLDAIQLQGATIGKAALRFLLDPSGQAKALEFVSASDRLRKARALLAQSLTDTANAAVQVERAISLAQANGGVLDPEATAGSLKRKQAETATVRRCLAMFDTLGPQWARPGLGTGVVDAVRDAILSAPAEVAGLVSLGPLAEVEMASNEFLARQASLQRKLQELRASLPRIGSHSVERVLQAADIIEGAGVFASLGGAYRQAVAFYRDDLGGNSRAPKATIVRLLRVYAELLNERESLDSPSMRARFGAGFLGYDTVPAFLEACVTHVRQVTMLLHRWPDLCGEVLGGGAARISALDLSGLPKDIDQPSARFEYERLQIEAAQLTSAVANLRAVRAAFPGKGGLTVKHLEALSDAIRTETSLARHVEMLEASLPDGISAHPGQIPITIDTIRRLVDSIGPSKAQLLIDGETPGLNAEAFRAMSEAQRLVSLARERLAEDAGISGLPPGLGDLAARTPDLARAAQSPLALLDRASIRRAETRLRKAGLASVVDWALGTGRSAAAEDLQGLVTAILDKAMADAAYELHGAILRGYSGEELNAIRKDLAEKDREVIALTRKVIRAKVSAGARAPEGNGVGRKSEYTEMALIRNELGKVRRRVPIRELTRRSWRSLMTLKPCWMMSPLAVSQFLLPEAQFDVVIIDEASQMTPENALGAISRAKQAVIVGDTKQLPPTSFFARAIDDSDIDEDLREDAESILDLANLVFTPMRQLRWHYRSQHADLIRFSNHWMYDEKLTIFPSADASHSGLGVELVRVEGTYKSQVNVPEARKVVDAAVRFMRENPDVSLGICTMNSKQRDLIEEEIERERERHPHVQAYIADWEERNDGLEAFFVKNLEAIQGDERDVMFISTLYGPETVGGKTHQRFGPINTTQGHRRLNVLFSRAKKKIVTFTSMDPTDVLDGQDKSKGVRMLRDWLQFARTGQLGERPATGGGHESPFEEHVAHVVEALGYEVVPQVGTAGYRVDLGVRHPDWPHGFIAGIECDGATYHSSRSARDRDRLREEILTGLGWTLHRIWSTDWFANPEAERNRVAHFLAERLAVLKSMPARRRVSSFNEVLASSASVVPAQRRVAPSSPVPRPPSRVQQPGPDLFSVARNPASGRAPVKDERKRVRLGCTVMIELDGIRKTFRIVADENNPEKGILRKDVPLAKAMLDLEEGDDFEFSTGSVVRSASVVRIS